MYKLREEEFNMTYRDRFSKAVSHQTVDRAPFDFDGTPMSLVLSDKLMYDIAAQLDIRDENPMEAILRTFDIDFRRVGHMPTPYSPLAKTFSPIHNMDVWGVERKLIDTEMQITNAPLKNATIEDLEDFPWPQVSTIDPKEISAIRDQAKRLYEETPYVVSAEHPCYGVLELGCWMCSFDDFLLRLALEPEFVEAFFDHVYNYQRDIIDLYYGAIGDYIHLTTSGDDFGTQNGPFMSPGMFEELIAPYYRKRIALTKAYTNAIFFHHSCGSVYKLIPAMLDAGVEILNPIQPNAKDMEPERLKKSFGDQLTFWGGVDTQHVLPNGSVEDVREHVRQILDVFGNEGGYVFAPAHCLQHDVPAENVIAMFCEAKEYYGS